VPDFSTPAAIYARARALFDDPEAQVRRKWEAKYMQPSVGNPAFERLPLEEHVAQFLCDRFVAQGHVEDTPTEPGNDDLSRRIAEAAARGENPFAQMQEEFEDLLAPPPEDDDG